MLFFRDTTNNLLLMKIKYYQFKKYNFIISFKCVFPITYYFVHHNYINVHRISA